MFFSYTFAAILLEMYVIYAHMLRFCGDKYKYFDTFDFAYKFGRVSALMGYECNSIVHALQIPVSQTANQFPWHECFKPKCLKIYKCIKNGC